MTPAARGVTLRVRISATIRPVGTFPVRSYMIQLNSSVARVQVP